MTVVAEFDLGESYRDVAVLQAADAKRRLSGAWRSKVAALDGLCAGIDPKRLLLYVFGMIKVAADDLDAAVDSLEVEAISEARRAETEVWRACQLILAAVDFAGRNSLGAFPLE